MNSRVFIIVLAAFLLPLSLCCQTQYRVELDGQIIGIYNSESAAKAAVDNKIVQLRNHYRAQAAGDGLSQALYQAGEEAAVENLNERLKIRAVAMEPANDRPHSQINNTKRKPKRQNVTPQRPRLRRPQNRPAANRNIGESRNYNRNQARNSPREERAEMAYNSTINHTQGMVDALKARGEYRASNEVMNEMRMMMASRNSAAVRSHMNLRSSNRTINLHQYASKPVLPDSFLMGKPFRSLDMREGGTGMIYSSDLALIKENVLPWEEYSKNARHVNMPSDSSAHSQNREVILSGREQWAEVSRKLGFQRMDKIIQVVAHETGNHFPDLLYNKEEKEYYMFDYPTGKYMRFSEDGEKFSIHRVIDKNDKLDIKTAIENLKEFQINGGFDVSEKVKFDATITPFAPGDKEHAKFEWKYKAIGASISDSKVGGKVGKTEIEADYTDKKDKISVKKEFKHEIPLTIKSKTEGEIGDSSKKDKLAVENEMYLRGKLKLIENSSEIQHQVLYLKSDVPSYGFGYNIGRGITAKAEAEYVSSIDKKGLSSSAGAKAGVTLAKVGGYMLGIANVPETGKVCFMTVHPELKVGYSIKGKWALGQKTNAKSRSTSKNDGEKKGNDKKEVSKERNFGYLPLAIGTGLEVSCQNSEDATRAFYEKIKGEKK